MAAEVPAGMTRMRITCSSVDRAVCIGRNSRVLLNADANGHPSDKSAWRRDRHRVRVLIDLEAPTESAWAWKKKLSTWPPVNSIRVIAAPESISKLPVFTGLVEQIAGHHGNFVVAGVECSGSKRTLAGLMNEEEPCLR